MSETFSKYVIVKGIADLPELEKYRSCFAKNGTERDMNNLVWLHQKNIMHANVIYYAMAQDDIAAIYTAIPVLFRINQTLQPGLQSIDTLTDVDHRGKGLFIELAEKLYSEQGGSRYSLVYGFPNDQSAPGFFKKLGWHSFGQVPFLIKPLSFKYILSKVLKRKKHTDFSSRTHVYPAPEQLSLPAGLQIRSIDRFADDYDALWKKVVDKIGVCVERNAAYMNWRYVDKPGETYYRYGLYENSQLKAVIIYSIKYKHDGLIGYVMDYIFDPEEKGSSVKLLRFANKQFRQQKTDAVLCWNVPGSFNRAHFAQSGYFTLPEKLRPQKLFLGVRVFNPLVREAVLELRNWYLSYSDSDTA